MPTLAPSAWCTCAGTRPSSPTSCSCTAASQPLDAVDPVYARLLGEAVGVEWPHELFLQDVDAGFYCVCYLQAWALETYLRSHLRERFGAAWFDSPEAGALLRSLWREGQRLRAGELLGQLTGERLDFRVVLADLDLG